MKRIFLIVIFLTFSSFMVSKSILNCITSFKGSSAYSLCRTDHNGAYSKPFRVVKTTKGSEKITVVDSYNLFYQNSFRLNSLKVKIEKSSEVGFDLDKEIILDNLNYMIANTKGISSNKIEELNYGNFTFYGMTKKDLNIGTYAGNYIVFPGDNLVCYFNFNNVNKDSVDTKTIEEFILNRNQFFESFSTTLQKCK